MPIDYKQAGVDIEKGDALVDWLKSTRPKQPDLDKNIVSGIGGFAALFKADFSDMKSPCLVSATDGIGTKVKWASELESYQEVGQDLVAMCVNDLICCGARPLFFLDYYATSQLQLEPAKQFLTGVRNACIESNCILIGGETAEMPGVYQKGDFDAAGFCVGVVDQEKALGSHRVQNGDVLLGVASSGFHSNGFSLLRKVHENEGPEKRKALLAPTRLYVKLAMELQTKLDVHAFAHITGGGIDNIGRVLPKGSGAKITPWKIPAEFLEVKNKAQMSFESLLKTFNCGIGLVASIPADQVSNAEEIIQQFGFEHQLVGEVVASDESIIVNYDDFTEGK